MKDLKVLLEDNSGILLAWEKAPLASEYVIMGKDDTFNDSIVTRTKDNSIFLSKDQLDTIIALYVEYNYSDGYKDYSIDRTNVYFRKNNGYKILLVQCIESYNGISISYGSNDIYDKYYIYEKSEDKCTKIIETEDFQICSKKIKEGHVYYIEAYIRNENNEYKLGGRSLDFICKPQQVVYSGVDTKVSIIIPAYNAFPTLARTIDSLIFSSLKDIEVILLNDGSKDDTLNVMEWYKNKYPELIQVIDKENEGSSKTRYKGLDYVHSKYVFFMDADDLVHFNMLKKMYECIELTDSDFVMNKIIVRQDVDTTEIYFSNINDPDNKDRYIVKDYNSLILDKYNGSYENFYLITLWHVLGKTSLFKEHEMPHFNNYEDMAYTRVLFSYANKFAFQMDSYYVWDRRYGLYFTSTSKRSERYDTIEKKIHMYVDSAFYFVNDLNMDRIEYLYLDAIHDIADYVENTIDAVDQYNNVYNRDNLYMELSYYYLKMYDVLNFELIKQDQRAYKIAEGILRIMNNALEKEEQ